MRLTEAPPANVAHRGASALAPENTLPALSRAVALGCDLVEVDVQRTRDGILVLVHDPELGRTTDARHALPGRAPWRVCDLTHRELQRLDAGSWFSPSYAGVRIPTLDEALELLEPSRTGLLLEVKKPALHPGIVADVSATLRRFSGWARPAADDGRLVVQSFDHAAMRRLSELEHAVPVGLLGHPPARRLPELATWASQVNPSHRRATESYVEAVHAVGMACQVWTVNRPDDMRRVADLGVDGVITNRPDVLSLTMTAPLLPVA